MRRAWRAKRREGRRPSPRRSGCVTAPCGRARAGAPRRSPAAQSSTNAVIVAGSHGQVDTRAIASRSVTMPWSCIASVSASATSPCSIRSCGRADTDSKRIAICASVGSFSAAMRRCIPRSGTTKQPAAPVPSRPGTARGIRRCALTCRPIAGRARAWRPKPNGRARKPNDRVARRRGNPSVRAVAGAPPRRIGSRVSFGPTSPCRTT